jgi:hypothetical protein
MQVILLISYGFKKMNRRKENIAAVFQNRVMQQN